MNATMTRSDSRPRFGAKTRRRFRAVVNIITAVTVVVVGGFTCERPPHGHTQHTIQTSPRCRWDLHPIQRHLHLRGHTTTDQEPPARRKISHPSGSCRLGKVVSSLSSRGEDDLVLGW